MNNSGISLIITMLLLIGAAVVVGTMYYTWSNDIFADTTEKMTPTIKSSIGNVIKPIEISSIETYYFTNLDLNNDLKITNTPEERFIQTVILEFINNIDEDLSVDTRIYCLTPNVSWASVNIDENNNNQLLDRNGNPYNHNGVYIYFNETYYNSSMKFYDKDGRLYYASTNTSNLTNLVVLNSPTKSFLLKGNSKKAVSYHILINNTKIPNTPIFKIVASTKYGNVEKKITFEIN
ncbi:hypothetical protein [Methanocaldococcus fervens]|uniref:Uncharacterized protein n=1 Tax=Methanocaldococcus fervens (strain DSM 4213 / JCM 15782 / AG86) TaxID=573064 RepID=C7P5V4_METFA|nr:hypothetical protein [Methanocaldococcus fervens]ACV23936.1 hypothetical protein Mefer_0094 [Methanocaldococcus fervens AG86]